MSKKVLILSSSPRRGGNSDTLCDEFLRGAQEAGHEVEKIFLKDKTIHYCTGCGVCNEGKPCPQKDDAPEIVRKMVAADVIVLATPVYFYTMSAQMKTLIDRCCAGYLEIRDKEFYFIVAAAKPALRLWNVRSTVFGDSSTVWTIRRRRVSFMASGPGTRGISKENRL